MFFLVCVIGFIACEHQNNNHRPDNSISKKADDTLAVDTREEYLKSADFGILQKTYDDPERSTWQNPRLVIEKMGSLEDKTVADIGAGSGYFTLKLAPKAGKVLAIDIDQEALNFIRDRQSELPVSVAEKIETRLSLMNDPLLADAEADIVLIVNTYHFMDNRSEYMKKVKRGLKPGGKVIIVDFKTQNTPVGPPGNMRIEPSKVVSEMMKAGFQNINVDVSSLEHQYIITAN